MNIFAGEVPAKPKLIYIPCDRITANKNQPREIFDQGKLYELAQSIKEHGILQPLTVRKTENEYYELIAGERRLRAARLVGLKEVPAILSRYTDHQSFVLAIIENIQRQDLNCFEEAKSYKKLIDECSMTQEELAAKLAKNQSTIANKLRLLKLDEKCRNLILENNLTERHARCLLKLYDDDTREKALHEIITNNLNVSQTEQLISELLGEIKKIETKKKNDRRYIALFKDLRIFSSTINQTVDMIKKAGIPVKSNKNETDKYIEYNIRISKVPKEKA